MGHLVDGAWTSDWELGHDDRGRFVRSDSQFRDWITADGSSGFPAEPGRYHLYVSYACPWACRTLIVRALKKLEGAISISVVDPEMGDDGWVFSNAPGCVPDTVNGARYLHEIYTLAKPDYTGRVTVPVLWDRRRQTIVNNESSEIIRMLNSELDELADDSVDLYPAPLRDEIDELNELVYENINDGVYKCGFAETQKAYDEAYEALFAALDRVEARLGERRYLCGEQITEADWRLFVTLVRFDPVYATHFKCNRNRLIDFPNLWGYTRELYQVPEIAATVDLDHIKRHYYRSHPSINPHRIVAGGFEIDFDAPHDRDQM